jgi:hypothetical protein
MIMSTTNGPWPLKTKAHSGCSHTILHYLIRKCNFPILASLSKTLGSVKAKVLAGEMGRL